MTSRTTHLLANLITDKILKKKKKEEESKNHFAQMGTYPNSIAAV